MSKCLPKTTFLENLYFLIHSILTERIEVFRMWSTLWAQANCW